MVDTQQVLFVLSQALQACEYLAVGKNPLIGPDMGKKGVGVLLNEERLATEEGVELGSKRPEEFNMNAEEQTSK